MGFGEGFEEEGCDVRAGRLEGELVGAKNVKGIPEDVVEGVYGSHLIQRLADGDGPDAARRLGDRHKGAGDEEVAALVVERAIADEFNEVGEPAKAVGVVEEWEGVVISEGDGSGGGTRWRCVSSKVF